LLAFYSRSHQEQARSLSYHYGFFARIDCFCEDTSRPESAWHTFGPKADFDRESAAIFVWLP